MDKIYQIYNAAYYQLFSNIDLFKELLKTFVKLDWIEKIDFETIENVSTKFISESYKRRESDIIYKVKLIDEKEIYIYIMIENQSTVDKFMPVRCLNYITGLYLELIKSKGETVELPAIFPIVLYNGDEKWTHSNKISDFITNNDILKNYGINFDVFLIKENSFKLDDLLEIGNIVSTLFITESYYNSELVFKEVQKILDKYGITIPVKLFLNYFKNMSIDEKIDIIDYKELEKLYKTKEEVNSMLLTAIRKEKEDLIEKGKLEGKIEGLELTAINMIKEGFESAIISKITGLNLDKIEEIRKKTDEK